MNKKTIKAMATVIAGMGMMACTGTGEQVVRFGDLTLDEVMEQLTEEQKVNLVIGVSRGPANPPEEAPGMPVRHSHEVVTSISVGRVAGAAADSYGIDSLHIPSIVLADGPAGLRINPTRENDKNTYYCTAFPTGTSLAASWDVEGVRKVTEDMGNEVKEYGVDILLAPAINIHRNPLCGRNFEYYSEDPLLTSAIATAYIQGIQSNGVGTSLKHYAVNSQETMRNGIDAQVSERALREIYLKGFEMAVKQAKPWTLMSSYNKVNGVLASENEWLLETVLRQEWGFDGIVMTDWWAEENGARQQAAGNDLLMPGTQHQYDEVKAGLKNGTLTQEQLDRNVRRMLEVITRTPVFNGYKNTNKPDLKAHAQTARCQAAQGMVLLENEKVRVKSEELRVKSEEFATALPLRKNQKVALFGIASYDTFVGGSGSGNVNRKYKVNINEGLANAGYTLSETVSEKYDAYLKAEKAKLGEENFWVVPDIKELAIDEATVKTAVAESDVAIVTISRMAGEGGDRKLEPGDYYLSKTEQKMVQQVLKAAHKEQKPAVLLLNMGSIIDLSNYGEEKFDAILHIWMPGQEAGNAVADVLSGKVSPSGRLPMTWAKHYEDYPSAKDFPLSEGSDRAVRYEEDVFVGYRGFEKNGVEPLYPFGHGLSYTTFEYDNVNIAEKNDNYVVTLDVKNTGKTKGAEVVQLYVAAPKGTMEKPVKELRAFGKTRELQPGEVQGLTLTFTRQDLASFDDVQKHWFTDPGTYKAMLAASAADVKVKKEFEVKQ